MKKPYVRMIATVSKFRAWLVDGRFIRTRIDEEFTNFGQHFRFRFIPKAEVWLDDDLTAGERRYVLLHEIHERRLMAGGMDYTHAHRSSSHIEYVCRHHPSRLKPALAAEMALNKSV